MLSGDGVEKAFRNLLRRRSDPAPPSGPTLERPWREALPVLPGAYCTLRELTQADAPALLMALGPDDFRQCPPLTAQSTISGVEGLIAEAHRHRDAGTAACWAIVPIDAEAPVGLIVVRGLDHAFTMVGASAAIAPEFRGSDLFQDAARTLLDGLFGAMGVHRVEARVDVRNARANGALRKLGAAQEGVLRHAQFKDGAYRDHVLWAIVAGDWVAHRDMEPPSVH